MRLDSRKLYCFFVSNMQLKKTFTLEGVDDQEIFALLPEDLQEILVQENGFVAFAGEFHLRGACLNPDWHSLRSVMHGGGALNVLFKSVETDDVPFAQDCFGDQFLLRQGQVWKLFAETDELENLEYTAVEFLKEVEENGMEFLELDYLQQFYLEGKELKPGELVGVWPPFCLKESENGLDLQALPAMERIEFLAELSREI